MINNNDNVTLNNSKNKGIYHKENVDNKLSTFSNIQDDDDTDNNIQDDDTNNDTSFNKETYIEEEDKTTYPDGFDANLYNLETKSLRIDKVRELLDANKREIDDLKAQKEGLRRIISKGKEPIDLTQYEVYKPDSKYLKEYETKETKEFFNSFNQLANNIGLNVEQHKQVLDFFNNSLEKNGVWDTRTDGEKELQEQDWRREQYKKLGQDAEKIIKKNMNFIDNYNFINEEQKQSLKEFANESASNLMIVNRFREILDYNINEESEIPSMINANSGLLDDRSLWLEFTNPNTTDIRKEQIIQERIKAGRPTEWSI